MFDQVTKTEHVAANPVRCFDIAVDFEHYPKWAHDVKEANVLERDASDRAIKVECRASALGCSTPDALESIDASKMNLNVSCSFF